MTAPIYHKYHPGTGELKSSFLSSIDPKETELAGEDVYLLPGPNTTVNSPLGAGEHEADIYDNGWTLVADYRGTTYYLEDGTEVKINDLGVVPPINAHPDVPGDVQDQWNLDEKREDVSHDIRTEGLRRVGLQIHFLKDYGQLDLIEVLWHVLDGNQASNELLMARSLNQYVKSQLLMVTTATMEILEAYDPATDKGWPDN